jgi:hypothetical protein
MHMVRIKARRELEGKETHFTTHKRAISPDKIDRFIKRQKTLPISEQNDNDAFKTDRMYSFPCEKTSTTFPKQAKTEFLLSILTCNLVPGTPPYIRYSTPAHNPLSTHDEAFEEGGTSSQDGLDRGEVYADAVAAQDDAVILPPPDTTAPISHQHPNDAAPSLLLTSSMPTSLENDATLSPSAFLPCLGETPEPAAPGAEDALTRLCRLANVEHFGVDVEYEDAQDIVSDLESLLREFQETGMQQPNHDNRHGRPKVLSDGDYPEGNISQIEISKCLRRITGAFVSAQSISKNNEGQHRLVSPITT